MSDNEIINKNLILNSLKRSQSVVNNIIGDHHNIHDNIKLAIKLVVNCFKTNNKLLFAGNGGSAADAQHMSAEYVSRFMFDRPGLASVALTTDTSALTAIGNDYGFENLFSRQIQALAVKGDVFFAYSTSGTSPNIIKAIKEAREKQVKIIGMTGSKPQSKVMADLCDVTINIPSQQTPYIQEGHLIIGHLICMVVEEIIFSKENVACESAG